MKFRKAVSKEAASSASDGVGESRGIIASAEEHFDKEKRTNSTDIPKLTKKPRKSIGGNAIKRIDSHDVISVGDKVGEKVTSTRKNGRTAKPYPFSYPSDIQEPPSEMLQMLYKQTKLELFRYKSPHVPLEGVLIGAVCALEDEALTLETKKCKSYLHKLQLLPQEHDVDVDSALEETLDIICRLETMRVALRKFEKSATKASRKARRKREEILHESIENVKHIRQEERLKKKEDRLQAKEKRKEEQYVRRQERIREKKKIYPKNVEAWREIMMLQTTLAKLKKEEREWKKANVELDEREKALDSQISLNKNRDRRQSIMQLQTIADCERGEFPQLPDVEGLFKNTVEDITLSADRITQALRKIKQLMEDADQVKKKLYQQYTKEFQFKEFFTSNPQQNINVSKKDMLDLI